ncbi:hypothetical protein AHF37_01013 [Paragonimus kellicotti]|nr:hypothetical protein AHF37_01013 [Paragonimus kellicotti]
MKPFIITRDAIQAAVFGAGYPSLPTMSLDELCTHQVQKGIFPSPKPISTDKVPSVRRIDPSESEKEAAEKKAAEEDALEDADDPQRLLKARQWDEFKDETRDTDHHTTEPGKIIFRPKHSKEQQMPRRKSDLITSSGRSKDSLEARRRDRSPLQNQGAVGSGQGKLSFDFDEEDK